MFRCIVEKDGEFGFNKEPSTVEYPLPATGQMNFMNSQGFVYEIRHVKECLDQGLPESPVMPLEATIRIAVLHEKILKGLNE